MTAKRKSHDEWRATAQAALEEVTRRSRQMLAGLTEAPPQSKLPMMIQGVTQLGVYVDQVLAGLLVADDAPEQHIDKSANKPGGKNGHP